jgi:uncharacterized protein (UPF0335 family)
MKEIIRDDKGTPRLEVYIEKFQSHNRLCLKMVDYGDYVVSFDAKIIPHLIKALKKVEKNERQHERV